MDPDWADVFPIKNGGIPASYVIVYQAERKAEKDLSFTEQLLLCH